MQLKLSFAALLASVLSASNLITVDARPLTSPAGMVTLPLQRLEQRSTGIHPQIYLQQHINRGNKRLARMSGREIPSDDDLRRRIVKRVAEIEDDTFDKRFDRSGVRTSKRANHRVGLAGGKKAPAAAGFTFEKSQGARPAKGNAAAANRNGGAAAAGGAAGGAAGAAGGATGGNAGQTTSNSGTAGTGAVSPDGVEVANQPTGDNSLGLDIEGPDVGYLATIQMGTPPRDFLILMDSGSADLWVGSENCQEVQVQGAAGAGGAGAAGNAGAGNAGGAAGNAGAGNAGGAAGNAGAGNAGGAIGNAGAGNTGGAAGNAGANGRGSANGNAGAGAAGANGRGGANGNARGAGAQRRANGRNGGENNAGAGIGAEGNGRAGANGNVGAGAANGRGGANGNAGAGAAGANGSGGANGNAGGAGAANAGAANAGAANAGAANAGAGNAGAGAAGCGNHKFLGPQSSSTFKDSQQPFQVTYGTGAVAGTIVQDDIVVAGLKLTGHTFGTAQQETQDFADNSVPFDGLMGLAQSTLSEQQTLTPIEALAKNGLVQDAITSYKIARAADNKNDGEITFGGLDATKFDQQTLVTLPNVNKQGFWEGAMDAVSVDGQDVGLQGRTAILDTGTTLIIAPAQDAAAVHKLIQGAQSDGQGGFVLPCTFNQSVALTFGGATFTIDPRDMIVGGQPVAQDPQIGEQLCLSGIGEGNIGGAQEWLVGDVFLKNAYFSTDVGKNTVSLAKLV